MRLLFLFLVACGYQPTLESTALCSSDAPIDTAPMPIADAPTDTASAPRGVIVLAGQSNAAGTGVATSIDPTIAAPYPAVRLVSSIGFDASYRLITNSDGALQPRSDAKFGVELTLGRALPQYDIVQVGINGSSLWYNWKPTGPWPTTPNLWNQTISFTQAARGSGDVVAFVWMQGESDAGNSTWAAAYEAELLDVAARVRSLWPNARFLYYRLSNSTTFAYKSTIRTGQESADASAGMYMVDVDDIGIGGYHFTSAGLLALGNRLAAEIVK